MTLLRSADIADISLREYRYASGGQLARHAHDVTKVSLLIAGALEETCGRRQHRPGSCTVVVKPAGVEHDDRFGPLGARMFSLRFPPTFLDRLGSDRATVSTYRWTTTAAVVRAAFDAYAAFRRGPECPAEIEAAAFDLVGALCDDVQPRSGWLVPPWLERVRDRLHAEYGVSLRVGDIAADVGVHPAYLSRAFRRRFGCSVVEYLRRLRVRAAADALAMSPDAAAAIATDAGFADQAHLCRAFKRETGISPGRYRRLTRLDGS